LNPQVKKPTDPTKLSELKTNIRAILNDRDSDKLLLTVPSSAGASEQSNQMNLCATFFSGSGNSAAEGGDDDSSGVCVDEVERYLAMGISYHIKYSLMLCNVGLGRRSSCPVTIIWQWISLELWQH
jgi:hypothetical protein